MLHQTPFYDVSIKFKAVRSVLNPNKSEKGIACPRRRGIELQLCTSETRVTWDSCCAVGSPDMWNGLSGWRTWQ